MNDVVIVAACRTAVGAFGGSLKNTNAAELAAVTMKETVSRAGIDPESIDDIRYAATKGGVVAITKTLAKELARFKINVNAVAPGYIKTPMTEAVPEKVEQFLIDQIPLRRAGEAEEVANAIAFLGSDKAAYITGQILSVNGGIYV